jgi:hypothetical protein
MWRTQLSSLGRAAAVVAMLVPSVVSPAAHAAEQNEYSQLCASGSPLCPDVADSESAFGRYIGHDEPSVLFYSNEPGSGNSTRYQLRLPEEPPVLPRNDGSGGTFNFQLHPAFWVGMALCDTESAPNPGTKACTPDTDANIFDGVNPNAADYIGNHPGTAFVEVQFYPPGWVPWPASQIINGGSSCDAQQWCAAVAIFSLSRADNTLTFNNHDCVARAGVEPFNFAFITLDGKPQGPPSPLFQTTQDTFTPHRGRTLFMNAGDTITIDLRDTPSGLRVALDDVSANTSGSITASPANGFQQVIFDPNAALCSSRPYAFHPMYSTSSEHTRVPWAAHSYNVAFSDEIGHFEYCPTINGAGLGAFVCAQVPTASDPTGADADDRDGNCAPSSMSTRVMINGCTGTDDDFDGPPYHTVWPGSTHDSGRERLLDPSPVRFSSPLFNGNRNYARVAFEADLPRIEATCVRTTGVGCTNPPPGAQFYPIFTTTTGLNTGLPGGGGNNQQGNNNNNNNNDGGSSCVWQFGGAFNPGTTNTFGGTSVTEYSTVLLPLAYPRPGGPLIVFNDYRRVLNNNPCATSRGGGGDD